MLNSYRGAENFVTTMWKENGFAEVSINITRYILVGKILHKFKICYKNLQKMLELEHLLILIIKYTFLWESRYLYEKINDKFYKVLFLVELSYLEMRRTL
jgi:hypothetical protein